jgi:AmiR/NasT family two-component response regulator
MLMAELHTSAADALARLRAHAFTHRRLLTDIAPEVVARRLHLPADTA